MVYLRIFMLFYIIPLLIIEAIFFLYGKKEFLWNVWIAFTVAIVTLLLLAKLLFAFIGLIE